MTKNTMEIIDFVTGNKIIIYSPTTNIESNMLFKLPEKSGTLALVKDVEDLRTKLVNGDITINDTSRLGGKKADEYLLKKDSNNFNIGSAEYRTGNKRNDKDIFGIEIDFGSLPNNVVKEMLIPNYNPDYRYWIDLSSSYTFNNDTNTSSPLYVEGIFKVVGNNVICKTTENKSNFTETKIVLNYTKNL